MKNDDSLDDTVRAIADRLRNYLDDHPDAQDTEHGIAAWWLTGCRGVDAQSVRAALRTLEQDGVVRRTVRADGLVTYRKRADG